MRKILLPIIILLTLIYPLLVYLGLQYVSPAIFGLLFLGLGIARFFLTKNKSDPLAIAILLGVGIYSLTLAILGWPWLLRLYPVVVSFGMAAMFALSLTRDVTVIESFAIAAGKTITANAKRYTRKSTMVWVIVLLVNGLIALYLAMFGSLAAWALYCGLLSYLFMGIFFLGEWLYRQHYIRRFGQ